MWKKISIIIVFLFIACTSVEKPNYNTDSVTPTSLNEIKPLKDKDVHEYMNKVELNAKASIQTGSISRQDESVVATMTPLIIFEADSVMLLRNGDRLMERVANLMKIHKQTVIRIEVHTDQSGTASYNAELSDGRARSIQDALISYGVHPSRIIATGFGSTRPISDSAYKNRRLVIIIQPFKG